MTNFFAAGDFDPSIIILLVVLVGFVVFMLVMPALSRRRGAQVPELYANLEVGDQVLTVGGILGKVVQIKEKSPTEKEILIETGKDGQTTLWVDIRGIYQNISKPPQPTNFFGRPKATADIKGLPTQGDDSLDETQATEPNASSDPFVQDAVTASESVQEPVVEQQQPQEPQEESEKESEPQKDTAAKTESAAKTASASSTKSSSKK